MFVQWMLNWLVAPSIQNLPGDPVWDPVGFLKLTFRSFQTRRKSSNYRMIHMNHVALTWAHQVPLLSISLLSNLHWASCLLVCPRNAMHNDFLLHSALNSWPWGLYSSSVLQRHLACQGPQLAKCGTTLPDIDIFLGPSYMCLTHCCMLIMPCRCSIICWMREIFGPKFGVWCRCWYPWRRWNQTLHSSSSPSGPIWFWRGKSWEVRGTSTSKREVVALAVSGTKKLWGQAEIKDCILIGELHEGKLVKGDALEENFIGNNKNFDKHQISDLTIVKYRKIYAYVLAHPVRYEIPQPFNYKSGCVIWCSLKDDKESSKKSKCTRATRKRPSCVKKWSGLLDPCVLSRLVGLERIGWEWAKNQHKSDSKS